MRRHFFKAVIFDLDGVVTNTVTLHTADLLQHGADIVVGDLAEITIEEIDGWFECRHRGAPSTA